MLKRTISFPATQCGVPAFILGRGMRQGTLWLVWLISPPGLLAQPRQPTDSAQLATITTDTGDFAPGHRDFTDYTTPGLCRAAARWTFTLARVNSNAHDFYQDTLIGTDTTGLAMTAKIARACGANFTIADYGQSYSTPVDLWNLADFAENDSLSLAVLDKQIAQATTERQRTGLVVAAFNTYLVLGRVAAAKAVIARVDTTTPWARKLLLILNISAINNDIRHHDYPGLYRDTEQRITMDLAQPDDTSSYDDLRTTYQTLFLQSVLQRPDSVSAVVLHAQHDLQQISNEAQSRHADTSENNWGRLSADSLLRRLAPVWYNLSRDGSGSPVPRLQADFWFPAPGRSSSDTIRPAPGKINLICMAEALETYNSFFTSGYGMTLGQTGPTKLATHLRHWLQMYGKEGLVVTVVRFAHGAEYLDYQKPHGESSGRLYQTLGDEARDLAWVDQTYFQLPVTVAVEHTRSVKDVFGFDESADNATYTGGACTVIGRHGERLYSGLGWGAEYTGGVFGGGVGVHNVFDTILEWLFRPTVLTQGGSQ